MSGLFLLSGPFSQPSYPYTVPFISLQTQSWIILKLIVRLSQDFLFSIQQCLQPDCGIMHKAYKVRITCSVIIIALHMQSHQNTTTTDLNSLPLPTISTFLHVLTDMRVISLVPTPTTPNCYHIIKQLWYSTGTETPVKCPHWPH